MTRVFLTGAFGNVGANALIHLARQGADIVTFDLPGERNRRWAEKLAQHHPFTPFWGDLRRPDDIAGALQQAAPDVVIHLAAVIAPTAYVQPELAYAVNVHGTRHLLTAAAGLASPPHVIYTSLFVGSVRCV